MVELHNAQITPLDRIEGNIWYGKVFQTETQKNSKTCKTAWGIFQARLPTGDDARAWQRCTICKLQQSTLCKRETFAHCQTLRNAIAPAAGTRLVAEERLSEHRAKSSGSNGDNDVSHLQSIQGGFQVMLLGMNIYKIGHPRSTPSPRFGHKTWRRLKGRNVRFDWARVG